MALTATARGVNQNKTGGTTMAVVPASNFAAGMAVLCVSADNAGAAGIASLTTVTDTKSNTWTQRQIQNKQSGAANDGTTSAIYTTPQDGGTLTTSDTITVNFSPSTTAKAWALWQVTGSVVPAAVYVSGGGTTGTGTSNTITTSSVTVDYCVVCTMSFELGGTGADDTDTTNGSWSTGQAANTTGGLSASNQGIRSQNKVVTGTATQTWNFTGPGGDWATTYIIVQEGTPASVTGTAAGAVTFAGTSAATVDHPATAAGAVSFTGTAVGTVTAGSGEVSGTAVGAVTFAGSASGTVEHPATASGSVTLAGTSSATVEHSASAAGAVTFAGTSAATVDHPAMATSAVTFDGTAVGEVTHIPADIPAAATGAVTFSGTATATVEAPRQGAFYGWGQHYIISRSVTVRRIRKVE